MNQLGASGMKHRKQWEYRGDTLINHLQITYNKYVYIYIYIYILWISLAWNWNWAMYGGRFAICFHHDSSKGLAPSHRSQMMSWNETEVPWSSPEYGHPGIFRDSWYYMKPWPGRWPSPGILAIGSRGPTPLGHIHWLQPMAFMLQVWIVFVAQRCSTPGRLRRHLKGARTAI